MLDASTLPLVAQAQIQRARTPGSDPDTSVVARVAWVSEDCPPQLCAPARARSRPVYAPRHHTALPARIDLQTLDRFCLEPLHSCAARHNQAGRPYVYMHIAARTGPRHAPVPQGAAAPWLSLRLTPDVQDPQLSPPTVSYTRHATPDFAHIDNIFFFCLVGATCQLQWLGSLDETATHRTVQLVITTLLLAERGEPQALLRAGLMFRHGLGVERNAVLARTLTDSAHASGATERDVAMACASMLYARELRWLGAAFPPSLPMAPSLRAHEAVGSLACAVRSQWLAGVVALVGQGLNPDAHWPTTAEDPCPAQPLFAALDIGSPSILRVLLARSTRCRGSGAQADQARQALRRAAQKHASPGVLLALETFFTPLADAEDATSTLIWAAPPA